MTFVGVFRRLAYEMGVRIGGVQMGSIHKEDGGNTETQGHRDERLERQDIFHPLSIQISALFQTTHSTADSNTK